MFLTEAEAKTRWCPHARSVANGRDVSVNREINSSGAPNLDCFCIAADCAMWVEIEPGKGVMGCNPVMAAWATKRLEEGERPNMVERRVYSGTTEHESYMTARRKAGFGNTFFEFDGAWWRYEHTSSDSKGSFDLLVRSSDETEDTTPQPDMGGWIAWGGGVCPVPPGTKVRYRMRADEPQDDDLSVASGLRWSHCGIGSDIVAYRVVEA